jgi:hypothetical protein
MIAGVAAVPKGAEESLRFRLGAELLGLVRSRGMDSVGVLRF